MSNKTVRYYVQIPGCKIKTAEGGRGGRKEASEEVQRHGHLSTRKVCHIATQSDGGSVGSDPREPFCTRPGAL